MSKVSGSCEVVSSGGGSEVSGGGVDSSCVGEVACEASKLPVQLESVLSGASSKTLVCVDSSAITSAASGLLWL